MFTFMIFTFFSLKVFIPMRLRQKENCQIFKIITKQMFVLTNLYNLLGYQAFI